MHASLIDNAIGRPPKKNAVVYKAQGRNLVDQWGSIRLGLFVARHLGIGEITAKKSPASYIRGRRPDPFNNRLDMAL